MRKRREEDCEENATDGVVDTRDIDGDGMVDESEVQLHRDKLKTQRRIATVALIVMCFLGIYITIWLPIDRIAQVAAALDLLWVTLGGVIAAYMGAEAWITRK